MLGRWMAHYVAECIAAARAARGAAAREARRRCQDAILALWEHRAELPDGRRPLGALEPVIETLRALDPDREGPFYHRRIWTAAEETPPENDLLGEVRAVDRAARLLLGALLRDAAAAAVESTAPWVDLASGAGTNGNDLRIIRLLARDDTKEQAAKIETARVNLLRERSAALDFLAVRASALAERYRGEISAGPRGVGPNGDRTNPE